LAEKLIVKISFGLLPLIILVVEGQSSQNYQLPKVIHSSPNAQNFERYGEIPVDYSTGVPNIDIPLYTIKGNKLILPLSISYHASGIKVNDIASEVGLGWVLNGKGLISRTTNGRRDEAKSTVRRYNNSAHLLQDLNDHYLEYECSSQNYTGSLERFNFYNTLFVDEQDVMSDRYFYKIPGGESGVFVYDYSVFNENENSVITLPYRPIKIKRNFTYVQNNSSNQDQTFELTDENGNIYTFTPYTISDNSSEWYVTQIKSADGSENIAFNYTKQSPSSSIAIPSYVYRGRVENYQGQPCTASDVYGSVTYQGTPVSDFTTPILNSIVTDQEIITFDYDNRNDFLYLKRLKSISIALKSTPTVIRKKIQFYEKYFGSTSEDRRLGLDYVTITAPGSTDVEKYSFKYNENTMLPPYPNKLSTVKFNEDFWGYANGQTNYTNIPRDYISNISERTSYGAVRDGDLYSGLASACMLQEIKYPTGGKTVFEFDRYYNDNLYYYRINGEGEKRGVLGGFRVRKISNYKNDSDADPEVKSYVYDGAVYKSPNYTYFRKPQQFLEKILIPPPYNEGYQPGECWANYTVEIVYSNPILSMDVAPGLPIVYNSVTEYKGTLTSNSGKTVYNYGNPYSPADYDAHYHPAEADGPWFYHPYHYDKGNFVPQLQSKEVYDDTNKILYREFNHYNSFFTNTFITGIKLTQSVKITSDSYFMGVTLNGISGCCQCTSPSNTCTAGGACIQRPILFKNSIIAVDTEAIQQATLLESSVRMTYDRLNPNKFVTDSIHYTYNQHNLLPKEISKINSEGETVITKYKYPFDFSTSEPYQTMLTKKILAPVIEQVITNNNKQIQKTQTLYKNWGNNIIQPEIVKGQMDVATPMENRIRYLSYDDKANPLTVKKEDGNPLTYLWGYNKSLPIAAVENAKYISAILNDSKNVSNSALVIPMGSTVYELGSFTIAEQKNYKIDRTYERYPENTSVMYQVTFENINNSSGTVSFTDSTPSNGNFYTFTTPSINLKPGNYKVKLTNIGYNGYQGQIENNFNFNIESTVEASIPFHTSFEEEIINTSNTYALTGKVSHTGSYVVNLPSSSLGYDKVIVSYWGKSGASTPWQYVENTVNLGNAQNYLIGSNFAYIDEVRVYPVGALMTTYTYDSFHKGQTSIMKPNGQTEYYDYDAFGRLKEVYIMEDNVKKLLKSTSYHYKP